MKVLKKFFLSLCVLSICSLYSAEPYNPVVGGEAFPTLYGASTLGGGLSSAGGAFNDFFPSLLSINPALSAGEENPILDLSYILISGIKRERGAGHVGNAGFIYPANWGVIGGNFNFTHVRLDSLNFGTFGEVRLSYAKDLTEQIYVGAGAYLAAGTDWALGADLGILYRLKDYKFFKNPRIGFSITGIGKPFNPKTNGVLEKGTMVGYPSFFTPHFGFASGLVDMEKFKMGMYLDLSAPAFCNLTFASGIDMLIANILTIKSAYTLNLLETVHKKQTHAPSFAVGLKFNIKSKARSMEGTTVSPQFAAKPFYNGIWGFAFGATTKFGTEDKEGPKIEVGAKDIAYISPNNDGAADALEVPLRITDKRYVTSWACKIKNSEGNIVRLIANKQAIRELNSASSFIRLLKMRKGSIDVPSKLRWDGMLDSGDVAPDGIYSFTVEATDDNKNFSSVGPYTVVVDNTPPIIEIEEKYASSVKIFSPDGDGNKDSLEIVQNGSKEDLWQAEIFDSHHRLIRTFKIEDSKLHNLVWDGKDEKGEIASDGVYSYTIHAKDRAQNENSKTVGNIILDTEKPAISLNIYRKFFSPNGDGVYDSLTLNPVLKPDALVKCSIEVKNVQDKTVRSIELSPSSIKSIDFDGKADGEKILEEGSYHALLKAEYNNGFIAQAVSPEFVIDNTPPKATVKSSGKIFSPDGDGKLDSITFLQDASKDSWRANIFSLSAEGKREDLVATIDFANVPPKKVVWAGLNNEGVLLKDGRYGYVLQGVDEAGNKAESNMAVVELNTEKADIILNSDANIFSPNNDGIKDFLTFLPIIRSKTPIKSYSFVISSEDDGSIVNAKEGEGEPPTRIIWRALTQDVVESEEVPDNATYCKDGFYSATLEVELENQQKASSTIKGIEIDTKYPSIELSAPYLLFSPNSESERAVLPIEQTSSIEDIWQASIKDENGNAVKNMVWEGSVQNFEWDALDDAGNKVAQGKYFYEVCSIDKAGNRTLKTLKDIILDDRVPKVYITQELDAFSPNNDGEKDEQIFSIRANIEEGIEKWSFAIKKAEDESNVRPFYLHQNSTSALPKTLKWNGKIDDMVQEGTFMAELEVKYIKGDIVKTSTSTFLAYITPPKLSTALKPKYFSPDNDGIDDDLFIKLEAVTKVGIDTWSFDISEPAETGGKRFWGTGGKGKIAEEIIWDGRSYKGEAVQSATDYPFTFTVKDVLGLTSTIKGYIPVDILIIRDGDKLKIAVPSIIFRPNANDFRGLDDAVVSKNAYVLKRVSQILNKFTDYQVQVEGHANSTTGTEEEEKRDLIPLSALRAEAVMQILIKNGVKATRLSAVGMGGSRPVASLDDRDNWWKNRRVEFVLIK